jgi:hypothetical protein
MCQAFSCVVTRNGKCYWKLGVDSHDILIDKFKIRDDTTDLEEISHAKIEIVPNNKEKYPYLYPDKDWKFQVDERIRPSWLLPTHENNAWDAWREWKDKVYSSFNYLEAQNPIHPLKIKPKKVTKEDIRNLKEWASVGVSVRDSVWASVGDSVWAYTGHLFLEIKEWKYVKTKNSEYPFQSCVNLWMRGFIPSFDGKIWRLHSGKNAKIVYEITKEELQKCK